MIWVDVLKFKFITGQFILWYDLALKSCYERQEDEPWVDVRRSKVNSYYRDGPVIADIKIHENKIIFGIRCAKRIQKSTQLLQDRLKNLCDDYLAGRKDIAQFLKGVSHNIRFGQPNV